MLKPTIFEQFVKPILPYFIIIFSFVTVIRMFTNTITFLLQTLRKPIMLIKTRIALCFRLWGNRSCSSRRGLLCVCI